MMGSKTVRNRPTLVGLVGRLGLVAAIALAGCAAPVGSIAPPTASPPSTASATASPAPATSAPTTAPTPLPTASPTCPPVDFATFVASDRLSDMEIVAGRLGDLIGFTLAPSPGSPVRPRLTVKSVEPPFTYGGSGLPFEVPGDHHVRVRFEGMSHVDDAGTEIYRGPSVLAGAGTPVRQVVLEEAFEGYVVFIVGYDGAGCVDLRVQPDLVTLSLAR